MGVEGTSMPWHIASLTEKGLRTFCLDSSSWTGSPQGWNMHPKEPRQKRTEGILSDTNDTLRSAREVNPCPTPHCPWEGPSPRISAHLWFEEHFSETQVNCQ